MQLSDEHAWIHSVSLVQNRLKEKKQLQQIVACSKGQNNRETRAVSNPMQRDADTASNCKHRLRTYPLFSVALLSLAKEQQVLYFMESEKGIDVEFDVGSPLTI